MLMSHSIARDPSFLSTSEDDNSELRLKILRATKVLVGSEFFMAAEDISISVASFAAKLLGVSDMSKVEAAITKRQLLWDRYSRPIFKNLFIENENDGIFIEETDDRSFNVYSIFRWRKKGVVNPDPLVLRRDEHGALLIGKEAPSSSQIERVKRMLTHLGYPYEQITDARVVTTIEVVTTNQSLSALEILLFLNMKNMCLHHYVPSKKELEYIPKPLREFYTYRVLDIYRERERYVSLADAVGNLGEKSKLERKAHLVRGHFKEKNGKLFWWNAFVRNARNAFTKGVVEKEYHLVSNEAG